MTQLINKPGAAGAVLQSPLLLIKGLNHPFPPDPQTSLHPNRERYRAEILRECSPPPPVACQVSCVTCHKSGVTSHVSGVICQILLLLFFFTKLWSVLEEGLLSAGPTPSS